MNIQQYATNKLAEMQAQQQATMNKPATIKRVEITVTKTHKFKSLTESMGFEMRDTPAYSTTTAPRRPRSKGYTFNGFEIGQHSFAA